MTSSTRWLLCFVCASLGIAQTNSATFRHKFGVPRIASKAPLKEVFTVAPNMEMIVAYGPGNLVCSLKIPPSAAPAKELHRVLEEVAPSATLGKKWNEMEVFYGFGGDRNTYYERAIVTEQLLTADREHKNAGASVVFKEKACGWKPGSDIFDTPREER